MITISKIKKKFLQSESVTDLQPKKYVRRAFNISCQLLYEDRQLVDTNISAVIYDESLGEFSSFKESVNLFCDLKKNLQLALKCHFSF